MKLLSLSSIRFVFLLAVAATGFTSCKKNSDDTTPVIGVSWTHNGVSKTAGAYEAYKSVNNGLALPPFTIIAGNPRGGGLSMSVLLTISLTAFNNGSYTISGTGNTVFFIDNAGNFLNGLSGIVNITSSTAGTITGDFSVTVTNGAGSNSLLTGNFVRVPVYP